MEAGGDPQDCCFSVFFFSTLGQGGEGQGWLALVEEGWRDYGAYGWLRLVEAVGCEGGGALPRSPAAKGTRGLYRKMRVSRAAAAANFRGGVAGGRGGAARPLPLGPACPSVVYRLC